MANSPDRLNPPGHYFIPQTQSTLPYSGPGYGFVVQNEEYAKDRQTRIQELLDDPRVWRPLSISLGPLPILCFIWVFFGITLTRPVALPDYLAPFVQAHIQSTTMIVAIIATIIASTVSFFFSLAVRYVIAIRLATSHTSLDLLNSVTRIAQKTLWLHDPRVKWTWIVLLAYIGVSVQTSGLISFLTIREVHFGLHLNGNDLDMASSPLLEMSSAVSLPEMYDASVSFFLQSVMVNALQIKKNTSTTFNFNGYTYLSATGGIQPASYISVSNQQFETNLNADRLIPPNLDDISKSKHFALPFNKTMHLIQQGFTANITCRLSDPQDNATYSPTLSTEQIGSGDLLLLSLSANCPGDITQAGPVVFNTTDTRNSGAIIAVACPIPDTYNYDIIIRAAGAYASTLDFMTCTLVPKMTLVNVTYLISPQNLNVPTTIIVSNPINEVDVPVWGRMAVEMLLYNILLGQSTRGSTIGNAWLFGSGSGETTILEAMNTYIQAAVEFTGTVIRHIWTLPDSPATFKETNRSLYTPINGTFFASTYGWQQTRDVSPLFILPTTVIILATYGVLMYGIVLARRHKDELHKEDADFDPTDIVHIIAAHTPETRRNAFRTFSEQSTSYMRQTAVKMQSREGVRAFEVSARRGAEGIPRVTQSRQDDLMRVVIA